MQNHLNAPRLVMTILTMSMIQIVVNATVSGDNLWYAEQFLSIFQTFVILCYLTVMISYRQLLVKTIAALWAAFTLADVVIYPMWYFGCNHAEHAYFVRAVLVVTTYIYVCVKSYTRTESDKLEPGYIYQVRAIPRNPQDMLLSILYLRPFGGTGVVCGEYWYHFRRGRIVRDKAAIIPRVKCVIIKTRTERPRDSEALNNMIGERWTWTHNCATILYPFSK